jgi:hypothetical protein
LGLGAKISFLFSNPSKNDLDKKASTCTAFIFVVQQFRRLPHSPTRG